MRFLGLGLMPMLFAAAACQQVTLEGPVPPGARFRAPSTSALRATLVSASSCDDLEAKLRAEAIDRLETDAWQIAQLTPQSYGGWVVYDGLPQPPVAAGDLNAAPGAPRHTETNTQVAGVDEGDFVETDGTHVYLLHDDSLLVMLADPPGTLAQQASVAIEGSPIAMYVDSGRAVVVSQTYAYGGYPGPIGVTPPPTGADAGPAPTDPSADGGMIVDPSFDAGTTIDPTFDAGVPPDPAFDGGTMIDPTFDAGVPADPGFDGGTGIDPSVDGGFPVDPYVGGSTTSEVKVTVFDVTGTTPSVVSERYVEGWYVDSRRHGDVVRVLVQRSDLDVVRAPSPWVWTYQQVDGTFDQSRYLDDVAAWRDAERARLEAAPLDQLTATSAHVEAGVRVTDPIDCTAYHVPPVGQTANGLLQVLTFSAPQPADVHTTAIAGRADTVYASEDTLVVAQHDYRWFDFAGVSDETTALHAFALAGVSTEYVASGVLPGAVHNSFSFDDKAGVLRVVSTEQRFATEPTLGPEPVFVQSSPSTTVSTFARSGGALVSLGRTPAFGLGEQVQSVRFVDDRAYVVTFRQVDPLFVVDVADATRPAVLGELEIPGFSTYMHPLDATHLLTIGQEVPVNGVGVWGLSLQLFDVSGTSPILLQKHVIENASSTAGWDHHAFVYDAATGLLGIPVEQYAGTFESTLRLFHVDVAAGFEPRGEIHHEAYFDGCWDGLVYGCSYNASMRRGLFIGDSVYAISYAAVTAHPVANVGATTGEVRLPSPQLWYYGLYAVD